MNIDQNIWDTLQIEPTHDQSLIRKAYANRSKSIHPEDNPKEFLQLKTAYQSALDFAKEKSPLSPDTQAITDDEDDIDMTALSKILDMPLSIAQNLPKDYLRHNDENPFDSPTAKEELKNHPGILALLALNQVDDATQDQWMSLFTSDDFLDIYFHHGLSSYFTTVLSSRNQHFRNLFFLAYQLHPQIHDPCPPPISQSFGLITMMFHGTSQPKLSPSEQAFGEAFRAFVLLMEQSAKTVPLDKVWKKTVLSLQKYKTQDEIQHWDTIISYVLRKKAVPSAPESLVDPFQLYQNSPNQTKYPAITLWLQETKADLLQRPPEYWQNLEEYLDKFHNLLLSTPENQQNKLTFVRPFFDHAPLLDFAIYDPDFMAKKQIHNLVTSTNNRLFLSKFLELCQNHPTMIDYDFFLETIVTAIWQKEEPKTTTRQQALQDMATELIQEFTPKKTLPPKKIIKKKKKK